MDNLVTKLRQDYPSIDFIPGSAACWSPGDSRVHYIDDDIAGPAGVLHELAHALLDHRTYTNDIDLLHKEVEAWERATTLAVHYGIILDDNHIQDCLDTYRDWVHKRSTCPVCHINGVQAHTQAYSCLNCGQTWQVSNSRLCRPYRRSTPHIKTTAS